MKSVQQDATLREKTIVVVFIIIGICIAILFFIFGKSQSPEILEFQTLKVTVEFLELEKKQSELEKKQGVALCHLYNGLMTMTAGNCTLAGTEFNESLDSKEKYPNEVEKAITALKKALDKTPIISKTIEFQENEKIQNLSKIVVWKEIPNYDVLPKNEQYTDFESLYSQIRNATSGTKSEFETKEEYNKKQADKLKQSGLIEAIDNYVIFYDNLTRWEYDAEKRHFSGKAPRFLYLKSETTKNPSYIGQNSFGVTKEVSSRYDTSGAISFGSPFYDNSGKYAYADEHKFDCKYSSEDNIFLPVSNEDNPEELSKQLYGLYVTKLREPWVEYKYDDYRKPTITDPVEYSHYTNYIITDPQEFWIIDNRNGKVLKKIKAQKCPKGKYGNDMLDFFTN